MKRIIVVLFLGLNFLNVFAQKTSKEFSVYGGGGFAGYAFQPMVKKSLSLGYSGEVGVGITGLFGDHWGIYTGTGIGIFNVTNNIKNILIKNGQEDCEGYHFELNTTLNEYKENHKSIYVNIPLMLYFQTKMNSSLLWKKNRSVGFYAMAGAKVLFLINNNYSSEFESLTNAAYYPEFDNWIHTESSLGLGVFNGNSASGNLNFDILAMVALETGLKYRIAKSVYLSAGVYFDCGLHDYTKKSRIDYNEFSNQEQLNNITLFAFTNRIHLMMVGITLRLSFMKFHTLECCPSK